MIGNYREEFPKFGKIDVALPFGFSDASTREDPCPRFEHPDLGLFLLVDHADPSRRGRSGPRFALVPGINDPEEGLQHDPRIRPILESDDWQEMLDEVTRLAHAGSFAPGSAP